jgi:hypothetical protein
MIPVRHDPMLSFRLSRISGESRNPVIMGGGSWIPGSPTSPARRNDELKGLE